MFWFNNPLLLIIKKIKVEMRKTKDRSIDLVF